MIQKERMFKSADLVAEWAAARNLIKGATPKDQMLKLTSEFGELARGMLNGDDAETIDGIGDVLVVAIVISNQIFHLDPNQSHDDGSAPFKNMVDVAASMGEVNFGTSQCELVKAMAIIGRMSDDLLKGLHGQFFVSMARLIRHLDNICELHEFDINSCLESAYGEIKDRRGVMYNGAFIKSTDPAYEDALKALGMEG